MTLAPGSRLGAYEVLSALGAGGMGEVYRARDRRLGRDVAIKVLPAERLADEHRRRRFHQEARALSSLNHPHIVTIHEVESAGDVDFIVMEFVRGSSLDQLIPSRGLPVQPAAAHRGARRGGARGGARARHHPSRCQAGEPHGRRRWRGEGARLRVGQAAGTRRGARCRHRDGSSSAGDVSAFGRIAGTPAYMAPEQATGGKVDARSDVFSFGAVLYEMATGARAFDGRLVGGDVGRGARSTAEATDADHRRATGTGAGDSAVSAQGAGSPLSDDARRPQRSAGARRRDRVAEFRDAGPAAAALVQGGRRAWDYCRRGGRRVVALEPHRHPTTADAGPVGDESRRL